MNRCYQFLVCLAMLCVICCAAGESDTAKLTETQGSPNPGENVEMLEAQLKKSTNSVEKAHLEEALGRLYSYRTGLVDPAKALVHLTAALQYELPERTYSELLLPRGNCHEFLGKKTDALRDYLRGLLACSYHELSGGWPEYRQPHYRTVASPPDPEWHERVRDSRVDRDAVDTQRFILMQRYFFVDAVKRLMDLHQADEKTVREVLAELSTDSSRFGIILRWINSENPRPNQ